MNKYINSIYHWTLSQAGKPKASLFLAFISFVESSIFPIPPDLILIPMILSKRTKAFFYAFICTIASVLGALVGYLIGALIFETIGQFILESYNLIESFYKYKDYYENWGFWLVLGGGFTPFPFKLITIASGLFSLNIPLFIIVCTLSRGLRFFALALLLWYFGPQIKNFIEKNLGKLTILFFILLFCGYYFIKFI